MQQLFIDHEHAFEFARVSRNKLAPDAYLRSRCIDGRYENNADLAAMSFPGADAGEVLMVFSAANEYGFEINRDKVFSVLAKMAGGMQNLQFHTDEHAQTDEPMKGCGYMGQARLSPKDYGLTPEDVAFVDAAFAKAKQEGARQTVLKGDHAEGVVFLVRGDYGIVPQTDIVVDNRRHHVQAFTYHQTLADRRHRLFAKELIEAKAVDLLSNLDESYLYEVFADVAETQLMETLKRLAKGLPIYEVVFDKDGLFELMDMGLV